MATVDEIRSKYCADDASYAASALSKWNSLVKRAKTSLKPSEFSPKIQKIDDSVRNECQRLYEQVKSEADALQKLARKMENEAVYYNRGKNGIRLVQ
ncbi:MAG: hypothetical protein IKS96_07300 [Fibrobacter sp.]|nr:hypothetical protein [Fibrobacter sp.]MBR6449734.1 hypothetical protein [Fibrobacter sp.]